MCNFQPTHFGYFDRFNLAACIKAGLQSQGNPAGDPVPPQAALRELGRNRGGVNPAIPGLAVALPREC